MAGKKGKTPEQIINLLRQADILIAEGNTVPLICKKLGISDNTYYKYRKEYGGMEVSQAKRLKELEEENRRLKKAVAELTLDKLILKEAAEGNF
jgi:putative transposase